jgi:hypothetical protein
VTWSEWGDHEIEARAVSDCGTGNPVYLDVEVYYEPSVDLGNDTSIYQGNSLLLDAGNPGSEYLWSTGATSQTVIVEEAGTYSVTVSNYCGTDEDDIEVSVIVGISEQPSLQALGIYVVNDEIRFDRQNTEWILCSTVTGARVYSGRYVRSIKLDTPGIYIVAVNIEGKLYTRKIAIF